MSDDLTFEVGDLSFSAQQWGRPGLEPVMALHGWLDNSASFERMAGNLSEVHLVAVDLAGHGRSGHREGLSPYNIWQDVAEIFAIADALGWDKFSLLGHSRGAIIAVLAAGTFPDRINRLGLIEGLWPEPVEIARAPQQLAKSIRQIDRQRSNKLTYYPSVADLVSGRQQGRFPLSYAAARTIVERGVRLDAEGYCWSTDPCLLAASAFKLSAEHIKAFIDRILCPVQIVLAEQGIPGLKAQVEFFARTKVAVCSGGHHLHMEEQAEEVAEIFQQFFG